MKARFRAISGCILFGFVLCHLLNHAFGLVSFAALEIAHGYLMEVWRTVPGTALLTAAFIVHYGIAMQALYIRRTLRLSGMEWRQIVSGFLIPVLLVEHVLGTRIAEEIVGIDPDYRYVMAALWVGNPVSGVLQALVAILAWGHGCIGLHLWLRVKPWYERWRRGFITLAVIVPVLSLAGYVSAGFSLLAELEHDHMIAEILHQARYDAGSMQALVDLITPVTLLFVVLALAPMAGRLVRGWLARSPSVILMLPDGTRIPVPSGATALEALRAANRPHAAVCGGRGRCTTCRVRVIQGAEFLEPPVELEAAALDRIKAVTGVRLACQIRPKRTLGLSPLLPPTATAQDGRLLGGLEGEERRVTSLFVDIRGSTRLGEEKLPYDVLFILNQFFSEMSQAIEETGGHYAQFNGDGLMALYGLSGSAESGAQAAIKGAQAMLQRLEGLNHALASELPFPLKVGIGLHHGDAIGGAMGPPRAQITSAIGDTINIAARLEGLTKEHAVSLIFSEDVARAAGVATGGLTSSEVQVRGRTAPVTFYPVPDPHSLG